MSHSDVSMDQLGQEISEKNGTPSLHLQKIQNFRNYFKPTVAL